MLSLTAWVEMLKMYGCSYSKKNISAIIKSNCLLSQQKFLGTYLADGDKVWETFVLTDDSLQSNLSESNIFDHLQIESKYEEIKYHQMWANFRSNYKKTRK